MKKEHHTYAAARWILGGSADGGNGGEADNSAASATFATALTTYAEVEKNIANYHRRRTQAEERRHWRRLDETDYPEGRKLKLLAASLFHS
jgi:hypothetical protein